MRVGLLTSNSAWANHWQTSTTHLPRFCSGNDWRKGMLDIFAHSFCFSHRFSLWSTPQQSDTPMLRRPSLCPHKPPKLANPSKCPLDCDDPVTGEPVDHHILSGQSTRPDRSMMQHVVQYHDSRWYDSPKRKKGRRGPWPEGQPVNLQA